VVTLGLSRRPAAVLRSVLVCAAPAACVDEREVGYAPLSSELAEARAVDDAWCAVDPAVPPRTCPGAVAEGGWRVGGGVASSRHLPRDRTPATPK
jgi:hypothetical protein